MLSLLKTLSIIALGGVAGFAVYKFVGCRTGTCPITSNPYVSIVYGMAMGALYAFA